MGFTTSSWQKEQWSRRAGDTLTSYGRYWNPSLGNWMQIGVSAWNAAAKMMRFHKRAQDCWLQKQFFLQRSFAAALSQTAPLEGISPDKSASGKLGDQYRETLVLYRMRPHSKCAGGSMPDTQSYIPFPTKVVTESEVAARSCSALITLPQAAVKASSLTAAYSPRRPL